MCFFLLKMRMGMKINTATIKKITEISQKIQNDPSIIFLNIHPKEMNSLS